jgi:hypothetical protein
MVISDKKAKKSKLESSTSNLDDLSSITISKFNHDVLFLDVQFILEFYDLNHFVCVAAKLDKKCPAFSNWNKRTYEENEDINFSYNNVAIVCGESSGIFVVDVDINDNGLDYFQKLCTQNKYAYTKETTCVLTPSGGIHLYFKYEDKVANNSVRMQCNGKKIGIDIRSNGGCVIAPPSCYLKVDQTTDEKVKTYYKFICLKKPQKCPDFILNII